MIDIVVDASAALAAVLKSQSTGATRQFFVEHIGDHFVAPHIFSWEIANVLAKFHRRGLIEQGTYPQAVADVLALDVECAPPPPDDDILALGQRALDLGLRPFDAAYLLLAIERDCTLASRDDRLLAVARRFVTCFDLQGDHLK